MKTMSAKLFTESDSWDQESGAEYSFKKTPRPKIEKKAKKRKQSVLEEDTEAGKFVRAPKYYALDDPGEPHQESPSKMKAKKRKQKNESSNHLDKKITSGEVKPTKKTKEINNKTTETSQNNPVSFAEKLRESLKGSRFRFLNEQIYSQTSEDSVKIFKEDETAFEAYHEGYRHQVAQWPMNPLDRIIKSIKKLPKNHVIVDMGCGDARLSQSVLQKVYSIDLVSNVDGVIESDMAHTPLEKQCCHVVVYCLSLMGTNLKDFFIEANRILKLNGLIKVAEVSSRFEDIKVFVDFVQKCGFELISKDLSHNLFYFINFKKTYDVNNFNKNIPNYSLKPCLYKKR